MIRCLTAAIIVWALCTSWLPATATLYLCGVIFISRHWLLLYTPQTSGLFTCTLDGDVSINRKKDKVTQSWRLLFAFFVVIHTRDNGRKFIWRDQCEEKHYRRLLYLLHQLESMDESRC